MPERRLSELPRARPKEFWAAGMWERCQSKARQPTLPLSEPHPCAGKLTTRPSRVRLRPSATWLDRNRQYAWDVWKTLRDYSSRVLPRDRSGALSKRSHPIFWKGRFPGGTGALLSSFIMALAATRMSGVRAPSDPPKVPSNHMTSPGARGK